MTAARGCAFLCLWRQQGGAALRGLNLLITVLDGITDLVGRILSWLVLYMVLATMVTVVLRYSFGLTFIALNESVIYAFGIIMTSLAGYALLRDQHVRVDVFFSAMAPRRQAMINLAGTLLFMGPLLWVLWLRGLPYVERSWRLKETSNEVAGLPYLYVFKTFMLVFVVVLAVQGLSFVLRNIRTLILGHDPDPMRGPTGTEG